MPYLIGSEEFFSMENAQHGKPLHQEFHKDLFSVLFVLAYINDLLESVNSDLNHFADDRSVLPLTALEIN